MFADPGNPLDLLAALRAGTFCSLVILFLQGGSPAGRARWHEDFATASGASLMSRSEPPD
jgi:hypothetical protein